MPPTDRPRLTASPPRRGLLKLLVVTLSTGLALGAAEIALRARHPFGFRMRGNTLVLPANVADVGSMIALAMKVVGRESASSSR